MKVLSQLAAISFGFVLSSAAFAGGARGYGTDNYVDDATVISASPVYQDVRVNNPREQCWNEEIRTEVNGHSSKPRSHTPMILGTIIGAAIGNRFSEGRGRDVATAAGAILGGSIGRDAGRQHQHHSPSQTRVHYEKRCELVDQYHTEQHLMGYDVKYRYNGQVYSTHTKQHPGNRIQVSVSVAPIE